MQHDLQQCHRTKCYCDSDVGCWGVGWVLILAADPHSNRKYIIHPSIIGGGGGAGKLGHLTIYDCVIDSALISAKGVLWVLWVLALQSRRKRTSHACAWVFVTGNQWQPQIWIKPEQRGHGQKSTELTKGRERKSRARRWTQVCFNPANPLKSSHRVEELINRQWTTFES